MSNSVDAGEEFVRLAQKTGIASGGHHNHNYVLPLTENMTRFSGGEPGTRVLVRVPRPDAVPVVIRTWPEAQLLRSLRGVLPHVPQCLASTDTATVLSYVDGEPLSALCPNDKPVDELFISAMVQLLARTAAVRREALPTLPRRWPHDDEDSRSYLRTLTRLADRQIRRPNWSVYGGLFSALGVRRRVLVQLASKVPDMAPRPRGLLHGDLHRDNVVVTTEGDPSVIAVDWELATYGDPLYDLATHLVRMRYPETQWKSVIAAWAEAMEATVPAAVQGADEDLPHYLAFERAQSVFPDVMRAARSMLKGPREGSTMDELLHDAEAAVQHALQVGAEPLGLRDLPGPAKVRDILYRWQMSGREPLRTSSGDDERSRRWPDMAAPLHELWSLVKRSESSRGVPASASRAAGRTR
ncbi:Phosphotransferase enzyme family protein [Streptomyces sp. 3213]|uniref:phosphotransferase family protein n=1 Tax=Streptomyces sp. 3213.3 TaxID=1855348 RepID=UPI00089B5385|nr:aminoglycoside phosphotransferase family protein [Streptomyces sp. 3213.3]SEE26854.1 Phosphotransferase enzyme family protein [Streptomyces sp. 3213] [Streptomyces sp. 3213.3]